MALIGKRDIYGPDGTLYMKRFYAGRLHLHIIYRPDADPDCHDHRWDFTTFPLTPYVEQVINPVVVDTVETMQHVLREQTIIPPSDRTSHLEIVPAFRFSKRKAKHTHRILGRWNGYSQSQYGHVFPGLPRSQKDAPQVSDGVIVTIMWRSKPYREWGFLKNRGNLWCWQYWKDYISGGRRDGCGE